MLFGRVVVWVRDDRLDRVVREAARREVLLDPPPAVALVQRDPARDRPSDRLARLRQLGIRVALPHHEVDRLARDAFREQLAHQGAIAFWPEPRALLDSVPREGEIVDVALRAELVDRALDRLRLVALAAKVSLDLIDAARAIREVPDRDVVGA